MSILLGAATPAQGVGAHATQAHPHPPPLRFYTVTELARLVRKRETAIYEALYAGELIGAQTSEHGWRISEDAVRAWMRVPASPAVVPGVPEADPAATAALLGLLQALVLEAKAVITARRREATSAAQRGDLAERALALEEALADVRAALLPAADGAAPDRPREAA